MTTLITSTHFEVGDDFYEALIDAHREFTTPQSHALNAKLILLLANHIGTQAVLWEALEAARQSVLKTGAHEAAQVADP